MVHWGEFLYSIASIFPPTAVLSPLFLISPHSILDFSISGSWAWRREKYIYSRHVYIPLQARHQILYSPVESRMSRDSLAMPLHWPSLGWPSTCRFQSGKFAFRVECHYSSFVASSTSNLTSATDPPQLSKFIKNSISRSTTKRSMVTLSSPGIVCTSLVTTCFRNQHFLLAVFPFKNCPPITKQTGELTHVPITETKRADRAGRVR